MAGLHKSEFENPVIRWVDSRLPIFTMMQKEYGVFPTPRNFNYLWNFGALAMVNLVIMIATGIFLAMNYTPHATMAFDSVERIMRDVNFGWLLRYVHANGGSMFFIVVYIHLARGLYYGSYKMPRELLWILGVVILLLMMATAFMGYVLPWGQMSYWGAQVIINLFGAIPVVGNGLTEWIRGDYLVADATLNRFFALHVIALPLVLLLLVVLHLGALHEVGSNNPDGVDIKKVKDKATGVPKDGIPFHPYYTVKDLFGAGFFLILFAFIVFFAPTMGGWFLEWDNFIEADPLVTPAHIKPVWYFTPFYAMLRAIPDKLFGVIVMGGATMILFALPWLDRCKVKSIRYRPLLHKVLIAIFAVGFVILGWLGAQSGSDTQKLVAQILTAYYFAFFILMPFWSAMGQTKEVPERVTTHD